MNNKTKNICSFFNQGNLCSLCLSHGVYEAGLCRGCFDDLPWLNESCERCALPLRSPANISSQCVDCFKRPPVFDRVISALEYRFPVNQLIQEAKFNQQPQYLQLLADLFLYRLTAQHNSSPLPDIILPVPMDRSRMLQRQYNHAALLAKRLANHLQIKYSHRLVTKRHDSPQQLGLDRTERLRNLRNMFQCTTTPPDYVAVVDDVVTTGATATEIARTLIKAGAERVDIWSVARTGKGGYL